MVLVGLLVVVFLVSAADVASWHGVLISGTVCRLLWVLAGAGGCDGLGLYFMV